MIANNTNTHLDKLHNKVYFFSRLKLIMEFYKVGLIAGFHDCDLIVYHVFFALQLGLVDDFHCVLMTCISMLTHLHDSKVTISQSTTDIILFSYLLNL